jgi:hypothetical protein
MSVIVIGVDPGDSTGVAIIKDTELFHAHQGRPGSSLTLVEISLERFTRNGDDVAIAYERFVSMSNRGRTHQPTAQKIAGALERLAEQYKCKVRAQGPADAHAVASNELLRQLGMHQTSESIKQPDANDANMAVRHALLYLSNTHATLFQAILRKHGLTR